MATITSLRAHTDAVISALSTNTGMPIGDDEAPSSGGWQGEYGDSAFSAYAVVQVSNVSFSGPIGDPQADATITYSIISIGLTREQAEWMSDKCRTALVSSNVTVATRSVMSTIWNTIGQAVRDDSVAPPFYYVNDSFTVMTTPS